MFFIGSISLLFALIYCSIPVASQQVVDYDALPSDTIFPGPWESNIRAPLNKSHIVPSKIFNFEGAVSGQESILQDADAASGISWVIRTGGLITFEFEENISGRVCFDVDSVKNDPYLVLAYSESPFFAGREPDATNDQLARDLPLLFPITHTGVNCVAPGYNRGGYKYLTVYVPENDIPTEGGFWHEGLKIPTRALEKKTEPWYSSIGQKILNWQEPVLDSKNKSQIEVSISAVWVNCTAFPSHPNGRAYTGYFDSSSTLLNRVWYAGAWTLQLSTLDPQEGGSIIEFNRRFDHNTAPVGAWYSNYTIANGSVVTTDGAKRDRMVWPGDMTIAVPGIAVTTYDMLAIRNALNTIYDHQYSDGGMPYAGPPMGALHEFSDTYHLHTLIGTYEYVLYSGDLAWLKERWSWYKLALDISIAKVDNLNLLHVTSIFDWIRPGMGGHNVEASSILYEVLGNSIKLAEWVGDKKTETSGEQWAATKTRLAKGIATMYCPADTLFSDNIEERSCTAPGKVTPQDGNSWALISKATTGVQAHNVSESLRKRWIKYGAPAVEFPNVISPFASSFELLGHASAGNHDAAVELMELMWGYMLDGPGMTNSTLIEGYRIDGYVHYPAYWSAARNSHAHGWSAGPTTVLSQGILGIELLSPLGKTWKIEPHLTKWLSYARGGFATKLGKFEVSTTRLIRVSDGRKVEGLNVTIPSGTSGIIKWHDLEQVITSHTAQTLSFLQEARLSDDDDVRTTQVHNFNWSDYVHDDSWVRPTVEERPEAVVDWEALEENYHLNDKKYVSLRK
ncbi:Six-hairpin glycosidase [Glarea lozoyensis ATCC 20868]|uniref:Six-hairpin glycosidase n=1 Tax=Glarea lozoyensis (strain ATCC 20868 / MF5171) TaxID=1116229 RepID=S3D714_GLAL2|nr:Six-hairpin glycosidase [Glarea lozoyensis ATCC 20868]EPE33595.1 Six-hairpin glycosidase [Glarea lozoyensis ATCC 20868]